MTHHDRTLVARTVGWVLTVGALIGGGALVAVESADVTNGLTVLGAILVVVGSVSAVGMALAREVRIGLRAALYQAGFDDGRKIASVSEMRR